MAAAPLAYTGPAIGSRAIGQRHVLVAAPLTNTSPVLPAPTLTGQGAILVAPLAITSPVLGAPALKERYTLTASPLKPGAPVLGLVRLPARLSDASLTNSSPVLEPGRLNPRYWTRPTELSGRMGGATVLSGKIDSKTTNLNGAP